MFYTRDGMRAEYRLEPCKTALTAVRGMPFKWSLNPYMGCAHRCTFCYVRHFEQRADRPSGDEYGRSIRVKTNVAEVLRRELARRSWKQEEVSLGSATDPYQPAEGRFRLTRACIRALAAAWTPFSIVTRGPLVVRDIDVLRDASSRVGVSVYLSVPTLDDRVWRTTEPGTAPPASRLEAVRRLAEAGIHVGVGIAPILPGLSGSSRAARSRGPRGACRGRRQHLGERRPPAARCARALPRSVGKRLARRGRAVRGALRLEGISAGCAEHADHRARAARRSRDSSPSAGAAPPARTGSARSRDLTKGFCVRSS